MLRRVQNGIQWLEFELFAQFPTLRHAIFLRHGGYSCGPYSSLNLSYTMGDDWLAVSHNVAKAKACLKIDRLASVQQVHAADSVAINSSNWQKLCQADALMTKDCHMGLKVTHADCQAAILYDPTKQVIATIHCGWRGQVLNIYAKTIQALASQYGCCPADIFVGIGPSLGPTYAEFKNYRTEFPAAFWQFQCAPNYFDLWHMAEWQLQSAGILPEHMQLARLCTYENEHDCFSYRRSQRLTGAHASMVAMLDSN